MNQTETTRTWIDPTGRECRIRVRSFRGCTDVAVNGWHYHYGPDTEHDTAARLAYEAYQADRARNS